MMGDTTAFNGWTFVARRFDTAKGDLDKVKEIFRENIEEEWTKYHKARYLPNAKHYIREAIRSPLSDFSNIEETYFRQGGYFWVLVASNDEKCIVGMAGLEIKSQTVGELRRMCLIRSIRRKGWGTMLAKLVLEQAKKLGLKTVFLSTPEHGQDVVQFYKRLGFQDTGKRALLHGSPIQEVFLEWTVR